MLFKTSRLANALLLSAALPALVYSAESVPPRALECLETAKSERESLVQAQQQGDQEKVQEILARIRSLNGEVLDLCREAGLAEAKDVDTLLAYADAARQAEAPDFAEKALIRAVHLVPDDFEAWMKLGEVQLSMGEAAADRAIVSFRNALDIDDRSADAARAYAGLASLYVRSGLFDLARETVTRALELGPDNTSAKLTEVLLDIRDGELARAAAILDDLQNLSPEAAALIQGYVQQGLGDFDRSRRWLEDTAENHLAYAKLLVRAGRYEDSMYPLRRAAELAPEDVVTWNLLGSVQRGLGDSAGALKSFRRSLEISPDQPRTQAVISELEKEASAAAQTSTVPPLLAPFPPQN